MIIRPIIPLLIIVPICLVLMLCVIKTKNLGRKIVRLLIIVCLLVTDLRISQPGETDTVTSNLNIIIVVDTTLSMLARDYGDNASRIDGVAENIEYLMGRLPGRYELITFDNRASVRMPLTTNNEAIMNVLKASPVIDSKYAKGTDLSIASDIVQEVTRLSKKNDERKTILMIFTDGENNSDTSNGTYSGARQYVDNGLVVGYGTSNGAKIVVSSGSDDDENVEYAKDYSTSVYPTPDVITKLDENNLNMLSQEIGVGYIHATSNNSFDEKIEELKQIMKTSSDGEGMGYAEYYWISACVLSVLLIVELYYSRRLQ